MILIKLSSYRKGGVYHDDFGEDATILVGLKKDVNESKVFKSRLQVLSVREKDNLPSGWMKWQLDPVSTVGGWMSILVRDKKGELFDAVSHSSEAPQVMGMDVKLRHRFMSRKCHVR